MSDLYLKNPPEDKTYRFVLQIHPRGLSAHLDFRYEFTPDKLLLGWTLDAVKSLGKIRPGNLTEAKKFSEKGIDDFVNICHDPTRKIVTQRKAAEPYSWLKIDNAVFPPGTVGATVSLFGYMWILDKGKIEYGAMKPHFTEFYLWGTKKWKDKRIMWGRFVIRALPNVWRKKSLETGEPEKTGKGYLVHMAWFPDEEPYCLCFSPEEIIYTPDGLRKAKDIVGGSKIWDCDWKTQRVNSNEPIRYNGNLFTVKSRYLSPVTVTAEHPFLIRTSKRRKDKLVLTSKTEWKQAYELITPKNAPRNVHEYVAVPKILREESFELPLFRYATFYKRKSELSGIFLNNEISYFLGWYAAEGCVTDKQKTVYLTLDAREEQYAQYLAKIASRSFKCNVSMEYLKNYNPEIFSNGGLRINIYCSALGSFLLESFGLRSRTKRLPKWLMYAPKSCALSFLKGVRAGDGDSRHWYAGASPELARLVQLLSLKIGCVAGISTSKIQKTSLNKDRVYGVFISQSKKNHYFEDDKYFWFPISRITKHQYSGPVYPLSCETSLLLSPMISHNSSRAVKKEWMPPIGISALPKYIRKQVPEEFQYWKRKTKESARKMRDDLFAAMKKGDVKISFEILDQK